MLSMGSQQWEGRDKRIPGAFWPAVLVQMASYSPVRKPVSKEKCGLYLRNNIQGCPLVSTHLCTRILTHFHIRVHLHMHVELHMHAHREIRFMHFIQNKTDAY